MAARTTASISKVLTKKCASSTFSCGGAPKPWFPPSSLASFFSTSTPAAVSSSQTPLQEVEGGLGWSKLLLFLPGAITFGLGTWQIFRRQEKIKVLEFTQMRLESEPITFDAASPPREKLDFQEFRRVKCQGILDEKRSIYVGPRSRVISGVTENGYYVITPLMPIPNNPNSVQSPVLVNRGWVPRIWRDRSFEVPQDRDRALDVATTPVQETELSSWWGFWSKKPKNTEDQVLAITPLEVIGVVRGSEKPNHFVPENNPSSGEWFYVDVSAIARACGLPDDTMYIEDINENVNPSNPYPIPKDPNTLIRTSVMPQDHLNYTLTWYSLSTAVTFMAFKRLRQRKSRR